MKKVWVLSLDFADLAGSCFACGERTAGYDGWFGESDAADQSKDSLRAESGGAGRAARQADAKRDRTCTQRQKEEEGRLSERKKKEKACDSAKLSEAASYFALLVYVVLFSRNDLTDPCLFVCLFFRSRRQQATSRVGARSTGISEAARFVTTQGRFASCTTKYTYRNHKNNNKNKKTVS